MQMSHHQVNFKYLRAAYYARPLLAPAWRTSGRQMSLDISRLASDQPGRDGHPASRQISSLPGGSFAEPLCWQEALIEVPG